jgi:photosystem II stability/assembly factor-like uncharacterized protein
MSLRPFAAIFALLVLSCGYPTPKPEKPKPVELPPARTSPTGVALQDLVSGTTQRLQAVSAVSDNIVWVSGTGGTYGVSLDGGRSWLTGVVAGAEALEFRDVHGVSEHEAYLLSSGNGPASRIYRTVDGGLDWQLQFINRDTTAFYDCFAFWDRKSGIAWSDNVDGRFPYLVTADSGQRWERRHLDSASTGEGAFAASGTCVVTQGSRNAWVATGAGAEAHVFYTPDRGDTWERFTTPIVQGTSTTGHTSIDFRNARDNVIITHDGGRTWSKGGHPTFPGAIFGAVYVPGTPATVVAVGPRGASWSADDGLTWTALDTLSYWSAGFASRRSGWLVGPSGRITKVSF